MDRNILSVLPERKVTILMNTDFETADLNETMLQSLKKLEHTLSEQAGEDIVLIAYSKSDTGERPQQSAE
ncbi:MAG: hypothetical protein JWN30_1891 [Bacilli bacterium]|nr:hypothetical protein [Bacilli bacterium]